MPHVDRNGVSVFYRAEGEGLPVLLSHGYSATSQMWDGQVAALRDEHRVITWDMRGHGQSDSPNDPAEYSEAATVGDMTAILDAEGVQAAVVGGLSLGGYMSLAFNLAHPARVRALMLFDTGPGYRNPQAREGWNETTERRAQAFEERGLEAAGRGAEVQVARHRSAAGLAHAARGMLAQVDSRVIESLEHIEPPVLVLVGAKDEPFLAATDYMAARIPNVTKAVIADAGHASNIDQPAAFGAAVRSFLGALLEAP